MEDNKTPDIPLPCTNGCGFYGNPIFQNMCSKCFSEKQKSNEVAEAAASTTPSEQSTPTVLSPLSCTESSTPVSETTKKNDIKQEEKADMDTPSSTITAVSEPLKEASKEDEDKKPIQKNKGRCFVCRIKIPLTKQLTNKCRCDYVFCDSHRYPDKHECQFDHASMDKGILAKNNPKLNDRPRGGRSFQRLDSL